MEHPQKQIKDYLTANGPATLATIQSNVSVVPRAVTRVLNALVNTGAVSKVGDDYDIA